MKLIILAALVTFSLAASIFDDKLDTQWAEYKISYQKSYSTEETVRRLIWEANLKYINKHNEEATNGKQTYTLGMNKYADMTSQEFRAIYNGYKATKVMQEQKGWFSFVKPTKGIKIPDSVDWRKEGYVTPVGNQGPCGSCWAFALLASLEGQHFKKTGKLVPLSVQNLMDCTRSFNAGCEGGYMDKSYDYIKNNGGIDTDESYPYTAENGECKFNKTNVGATLTGYTCIKSGVEDDLTRAIANQGPISVAIDASHMGFQLYKSGVYNEPHCSSTTLDHTATAVGYDSKDGQDYYIVKNSWGTSWGMDGYILMSRNKENQCGIASSAIFPTV